MKMPTGLSRQVILSMSAAVLTGVLIVTLSSYIFYALLLSFWPSAVPVPGDWVPSALEWAWMAMTTLAAVALAVPAAIRLSRRILTPLTSVADSLRLLALGHLDARAVTDDQSLGEASQLVDDFNSMAIRLQRMTQEQIFWNAAIAHELRTPVTILRGRIQGLADGVFEPNAAQFNSLLTQVEGLSGLIEDLRVVGLADSGHLKLQLHEVDLSAEITAVVQLFEPSLRAAGLALSLELEQRPVHCDAARIRQALLALLENARRHATPGVVRIQTRVAQGRYHLLVEDEGPGIPSEMAAQIFEAFQRGAAAHTRDGAGSGLGLAVVRAIAQAHGGQAECRSSERGGTVFDVSWPL